MLRVTKEWNAYPWLNARRGDFQGNKNSAELVAMLRRIGKRAKTHDEREHWVEQVFDFLASKSITLKQADSLLGRGRGVSGLGSSKKSGRKSKRRSGRK